MQLCVHSIVFFACLIVGFVSPLKFPLLNRVAWVLHKSILLYGCCTFFLGGRLPHRKVVCILDIFNRINHFERGYFTLWPLRPLALRATFWPLRHFLPLRHQHGNSWDKTLMTAWKVAIFYSSAVVAKHWEKAVFFHILAFAPSGPACHLLAIAPPSGHCAINKTLMTQRLQFFILQQLLQNTGEKQFFSTFWEIQDHQKKLGTWNQISWKVGYEVSCDDGSALSCGSQSPSHHQLHRQKSPLITGRIQNVHAVKRNSSPQEFWNTLHSYTKRCLGSPWLNECSFDILSWCFQIPSLVQFRNDFCGESSNWKPRFLIGGSDINNGTFPSSTMSNSVVCTLHDLSYMWITNFSVHLVCCEFAKKNLELVGSILYHSPQSWLST